MGPFEEIKSDIIKLLSNYKWGETTYESSFRRTSGLSQLSMKYGMLISNPAYITYNDKLLFEVLLMHPNGSEYLRIEESDVIKYNRLRKLDEISK